MTSNLCVPRWNSCSLMFTPTLCRDPTSPLNCPREQTAMFSVWQTILKEGLKSPLLTFSIISCCGEAFCSHFNNLRNQRSVACEVKPRECENFVHSCECCLRQQIGESPCLLLLHDQASSSHWHTGPVTWGPWSPLYRWRNSTRNITAHRCETVRLGWKPRGMPPEPHTFCHYGVFPTFPIKAVYPLIFF